MAKIGEMERVLFSSDDVGVMLLESITKGLYHNPLNSVREYVQNEFDAGATIVRITVTGGTVKITGDGPGMSEEELMSARRIGYSNKDPTQHVGFRGIGIWSGVAICDEVFVSTKQRQETEGHVLKIDATGLTSDITEGTLPLIDALSRRVLKGSAARGEFREKQGTSIELRGILSENIPLLKKEDLLAYSQQVFPVKIDPKYQYAEVIEDTLRKLVPDYRTIRIFVNDVEVFRPPLDGTETLPPNIQAIEGEAGRVIAVAWYSISRRRRMNAGSRYLVYKKKMFTVGDTTRSNLLILKSIDLVAFAWATGEIHVVDNEVIPTSERTDFESNPAQRRLEEKARELLAEIVRSVRKHQAGSTAKQRLHYVVTFKQRFLTEGDPEERMSIFAECQEYLKLLSQDLNDSRIGEPLKKRVRAAYKRLKRDLQFMATNFEIPTGFHEAQETETRRRRRVTEKAEAPTYEEVRGQLGGVFPWDHMSYKLLRAVMSAVSRLVKGSDTKIASFITLLREELEALNKRT